MLAGYSGSIVTATAILISAILNQYAESVAFKRPGAVLSDDEIFDKDLADQRPNPRKVAETLYEVAEHKFYMHFLKPECKLPRERGQSNCSNARINTIQWYWDVETEECLAFRFNGCGGNANQFISKRACEKQCRPSVADDDHCLGRKAPAMNDKGEIVTCVLPDLQNNNSGKSPAETAEICPDGYQCVIMNFFGMCCNVETAERYRRNYRPTCPNGKQLIQIKDELKKLNVTYLGKNCADEFCPELSTCHQQEIFAHCCSK